MGVDVRRARAAHGEGRHRAHPRHRSQVRQTGARVVLLSWCVYVRGSLWCGVCVRAQRLPEAAGAAADKKGPDGKGAPRLFVVVVCSTACATAEAKVESKEAKQQPLLQKDGKPIPLDLEKQPMLIIVRGLPASLPLIADGVAAGDRQGRRVRDARLVERKRKRGAARAELTVSSCYY